MLGTVIAIKIWCQYNYPKKSYESQQHYSYTLHKYNLIIKPLTINFITILKELKIL